MSRHTGLIGPEAIGSGSLSAAHIHVSLKKILGSILYGPEKFFGFHVLPEVLWGNNDLFVTVKSGAMPIPKGF